MLQGLQLPTTVELPVSGHPRDQKNGVRLREVSLRLWEVKNVVFVCN